MKKRRAAALLAAVCIVYSLAGCTSAAEDASTAEDKSATEDTSTGDTSAGDKSATEDTSTEDTSTEDTPTEDISTGDMSTGTSLLDYCTESQQIFLEQAQETPPVEVIFHYWTETTADYKTTDEKVISMVLQALRKVRVVSRSNEASTDNQGLSFVTEKGDTCSFWFNMRQFEGADGGLYVLEDDRELWGLLWEIREADLE